MLGLLDYGARWYDSLLGRFVQPDTVVPDPFNPQDWDRYSYVRNNPVRYIDPSGHDVDCSPWDTYCKENVKLEREQESGDYNYPDPKPGEPSTDQLSQLIDANDHPFDPSLGGNLDNEEHDLGSKENPSDERPSVSALITIGIPLTAAIVLVEAGLTYAEIQIGLATLVQPELAPATIPLELLLAGASLALIDIDVAYWSYTYRVAFTPEGEPVKFETLPPWGLDN